MEIYTPCDLFVILNELPPSLIVSKNVSWHVHLSFSQDELGDIEEFDDYMAYLMLGLGHADRHSGLTDYCIGLMLPISRSA